MSNQFFPFGLIPGSNPAQSFPYDVIINEIDPGLILDPTEPNGVYVAFREVAGCSWWVLNADFITDANQWQQNPPQNAALPAYAIEQCQDGTWNRYVTPATNTPGTPITWIKVWSMDPLGNITSSPQVEVTGPGIAFQINTTWNSGSPTQMDVFKINLTDTSSNAASYLEQFYVNGTPVWQIRKDGTLVSGAIPFSLITGYTPPSFNDVTLTGTTTCTGPLDVDGFTDLEGGASVEGGFTVDSFHDTGPAQVDGNLTVNGTSHLVGHITADNGLTVTSGGLSVTGGETVDSLHVTGNAQIDGTATINNLTVTGTTTSTSGPLVNVESLDSSITVTTPSANTYNLQVNPAALHNVSTFGSNPSSTPGQGNPETFTFMVPDNPSGPGYIVVVTIVSPSASTTFSGTVTGGGFSTIPAYEVFTNVSSVLKTASCSNGDVVTITLNLTPNPATDYVQGLITLYGI